LTPSFAVIGIQTPHWHTPRLWLPVFLLWIPVLLLAPFALLLLAALAIVARTTVWRLIGSFWSILSSLPGTYVHVCAEENQVLVHLL
jgi:hypothetical protein